MFLAVFVVKALSFLTSFSSHHTEKHDFLKKHQTRSKAATRKTVLCAWSSSQQEVKVRMEETPLNRNVQLVLIHEHKKQQAKCSPSAPDGNLVCSPKLGLDLYPSIAVKKFSFIFSFFNGSRL